MFTIVGDVSFFFLCRDYIITVLEGFQRERLEREGREWAFEYLPEPGGASPSDAGVFGGGIFFFFFFLFFKFRLVEVVWFSERWVNKDVEVSLRRGLERVRAPGLLND